MNPLFVQPRRPLPLRLLRALAILAGLLLAVCVLLFAIAWLLPDEAPSPASLTLLETRPPVPEQGNGALILAGLRAPSGSDYETFGRDRLAHVMAHFSQTGAGSYRAPDLPADALPLPDTEALCNPTRTDCLENWLGQATQVIELANGHREVLARFNVLLRQPVFRMPVALHPEAPVGDFAPLAALMRLQLAEASIALENGDTERALDAMAAQTAFLRRMLTEPQSSLIQKMVATSLLRAHHKVLGEWLHRWPDAVSGQEELAALLVDADDAELDMRGALHFETAWVGTAFMQLRVEGDEAQAAGRGMPPWLERLLLTALYKRQATLNTWAAHAVELDAALGAPHAGRLAGLQAAHRDFLAGPADPSDIGRILFNPAGRMLLTIGSADYSDYLLRLYDTQAVGRMVALEADFIADDVSPADIPARLQRDPRASSPAAPEHRITYDAERHALVWTPLGQKGPVEHLEDGVYRVRLPH